MSCGGANSRYIDRICATMAENGVSKMRAIILIIMLCLVSGCRKTIEMHRDILVLQDTVTSEVIFAERLDPDWNVRYDKDNGVLYCDFGYEGKWLAFR